MLEEFLDTVFDGKTSEEHVLLLRQKSLSADTWPRAPWPSKAATSWLRSKNPGAIYFTVSTVCEPEPGQPWRKRQIDCQAAYVIVLDDIGTKVVAPAIEPSYKLESSKGNFQYGYLIEPTEDLDHYGAIVNALGELGYTDKGAGGYNRVMRVPGSINIKTERNGFVSQITDWQPGRTWDLDDLAESLGVDLDNLDVKSTKMQGAVGGKKAEMAIDDPLLTWLNENDQVVDDHGGDWVNVLCPWAEAHTTGAGTAGYSPLGRGTGDWVETRAFKCLHEHCADRRFKDYGRWAAELGGPVVFGHDPLPWLQDRYVFIEEGRQVADMYQRPKGGYWIMELETFNMRHHRRIMVPGHDRPVLAKNALLEHRDTRKAARLVYDPSQGHNPVFDLYQQLVVNTYIPPDHAVSPEDDVPERFVRHMEYLAPLKNECDILLDWLAYWVQNPGQRLFALVMVADGAFGIGRSWLADMCGLLEPGHIKRASLAQLIGKGSQADQNYNDWQTGCRMIVADEAKDISRDDFYRGYEVFKQRIDIRPVPIEVNPKFGRKKSDMMFFSALIFSNHADALAIPEGDRRVCVLTNPAERKPFDYYEGLQECLTPEYAGRVYWWLMRREVDPDWNVYPPMTQGKLRMIEANAAPLDQILEHVSEHADGDLVTHRSFSNLCRRAIAELQMGDLYPGVKIEKATRPLWKRLSNLRPDEKNGARYSVDGRQEEIRALRSPARWRAVDETRDRELLLEELDKNQVASVELLSAVH